MFDRSPACSLGQGVACFLAHMTPYGPGPELHEQGHCIFYPDMGTVTFKSSIFK